ncbi:23S rRNA (guanosine(2251)-2'-O)-methyltransferase RlmB [Namhaeicola litoreus]|uniref:23S rRNA (Guanosine(2251)-2'-O)-methyltransferase RlmB n=1 Tax=Namhaeicola litoreus TaxID=1052145 RepID=A0ABW3Y560_9FLAO
MEESTTIFGIRAILEAIKAGKEIEKLYLLQDLKGDLATQLKQSIAENKITKSYVPIEKLNKLAKNQNHQGAVAKISVVKTVNLDSLIENLLKKESTPLVLLLDQITDVRNFGAILRTAECTGVDAVIFPKQGNAPINADTVKTSAGAAFNLPLCRVDHSLDAIYAFQQSGFKVIAVTEKTDTSFYTLTFEEPTVLIMGSEEKGISNGILKIVDAKGKLPLLGKIESLNVSVACGAALYEIVRQRALLA